MSLDYLSVCDDKKSIPTLTIHMVSLSTTFKVEIDTVGTSLEQRWYDLFSNVSSDSNSHMC